MTPFRQGRHLRACLNLRISALFITALNFIIFSLNQQGFALRAFFSGRLVPESKVAFWPAGAGIKYFAFFGFSFNNVALNAFWADSAGGNNYRFRVFAFRKTGAGVEFAKAAQFNDQRQAAFGAFFISRLF